MPHKFGPPFAYLPSTHIEAYGSGGAGGDRTTVLGSGPLLWAWWCYIMLVYDYPMVK